MYLLAVQLQFKMGKSIDGQFRLIRLVLLIRSKMDNFSLFFINKRTNDELPLAQLANGERIKENHWGLHFLLEMAA